MKTITAFDIAVVFLILLYAVIVWAGITIRKRYARRARG